MPIRHPLAADDDAHSLRYFRRASALKEDKAKTRDLFLFRLRTEEANELGTLRRCTLSRTRGPIHYSRHSVRWTARTASLGPNGSDGCSADRHLSN